MSYDLEIWSIKQVDLTELLTKNNCKRAGDDFSYEAKGWRIVINPQNAVMDEDIPLQIMGALPGIKFQLEINLEPITAPKKAISLVKKISSEIAKLTSGIIIDHQKDTVTTPKGAKRFIQVEKFPKMDIVELSWWMNHDIFTTADNLQKLLNIIEVYLPEALPRRYGTTEPPQNKFTSKEAFIDFLVQNAQGFTIWYPKYPALDVHLGIPSHVGLVKVGGKPRYRSTNIKVSIDAAVLSSEGWPLALRRFFREMSILLRPFYGEIRVLHNYYRGRGTFAYGSDTEEHPITGWWWRGIPIKIGLAMVLGEPLLRVWPEFLKKSEKIADLQIVDNFRNGIFYEVNQELLEPPIGLRQPEDGSFPKQWPFEWPKEF